MNAAGFYAEYSIGNYRYILFRQDIGFNCELHYVMSIIICYGMIFYLLKYLE